MAETPTEYLDRVTALFTAAFESSAVVNRDDRPDRCLLEMTGQYGIYRVRLLEVVAPNAPRKYAYYVLQDDRVIVGFDNVPDPQVRRLKYGSAHAAHRYERIPHCHATDKASTELAPETTCADFIAWVESNLA